MATSRGTFLARIAVGGGACALGARSAGAQSLAAHAIVQPTVDATPYYYALHEDLFGKAGLHLTSTSIASGNLTIQSVVAGAAQIGLANTLSIAQAHVRGIPLQLLFGAGFHAPDAPIVWIFVGGNSSIAHAKDLEGATFAVNGLHDLLALAARAWLAQQGADPDKVHFVELPQAQMLAALQAKRVDAVCSFEPFASAIRSSGDARAIATPYDAIAKAFNVTVWFAWGPWIGQNRAAAARFVGAMRDAGTYANAHLTDMIPIVAAATNTRGEDVAHALKAKTSLGIVPAQVQPVIDAAARFGEIAAAFPARELLPDPAL